MQAKIVIKQTKQKSIIFATMIAGMMIVQNAQGQTWCLNGGTCGADAGPDKTYCYCCGPAPTIGAADCSSGTNTCPNGTPSSGVTYLWTPSSGLSNTTICNPTATPASTTTYTLTVTYACNQDCCCLDCCSGTSCTSSPWCGGTCVRKDAVKVTVGCPGGCCRISNPDKQAEVTSDDVILYPNPNPGIFTLEVEKIKPNMAIHVYNMQGDGVWAEVNVSEKQTIDISSLSKGMYFVEVKSSEKVIFYKKIIAQ